MDKEKRYTCKSVEVDGGQYYVCDVKHRTLPAAVRCMKGMPCGMFREYRGEIIEIESGAVVKRFACKTKTTVRGSTGILTAVWVEDRR